MIKNAGSDCSHSSHTTTPFFIYSHISLATCHFTYISSHLIDYDLHVITLPFSVLWSDGGHHWGREIPWWQNRYSWKSWLRVRITVIPSPLSCLLLFSLLSLALVSYLLSPLSSLWFSAILIVIVTLKVVCYFSNSRGRRFDLEADIEAEIDPALLQFLRYRAIWRYVMPCNVVPYDMMSFHVICCHIILCHVIRCHVISCRVMWYFNFLSTLLTDISPSLSITPTPSLHHLFLSRSPCILFLILPINCSRLKLVEGKDCFILEACFADTVFNTMGQPFSKPNEVRTYCSALYCTVLHCTVL